MDLLYPTMLPSAEVWREGSRGFTGVTEQYCPLQAVQGKLTVENVRGDLL